MYPRSMLQQVGEKALKALYYVGRKLHPKTHDLEKLFEMLPSEIIVENQALL